MKQLQYKPEWLLMFIILATGFFVSLLAVNMYFLSDDSYYLLTSEHTTIAQAILHPMDMAMGWYRPVVAITWFVGAHLWGSNTWGYQLIIAALFTAILYMVYRLGKELSDTNTGIIASALYLTYFPLLLSTWSKATFCYLFETLFSILAVFVFIKGFNGKNKFLMALSIFFGILAFLSRESAIVLFLVLAAYVVIYRAHPVKRINDLSQLLSRDDLKGLLAPAILGIFVLIIYVAVNILTHIRNNVDLSISSSMFNMAIMLGTYGLFMNASLIALAVIINIVKGANKLSLGIASLVLVISLAWAASNVFSQGDLIVGLPVLLLTGIAYLLLVASFFLSGPGEKMALALFAITLVPDIISVYVGYGYYFTSAVGLTIFMGMQFSKYIKSIAVNMPSKAIVLNLTALLFVAILVIAIVLKAQYLPFLVGYLTYNTDVSNNEKDIMAYLSQNTPNNSIVYQDDRPDWSTKLVILGRDQNLNGIVERLTSDEMYRLNMQQLDGRGDIQFSDVETIDPGNTSMSGNVYLISYNDTTKNTLVLPENMTLKKFKTFSTENDVAQLYKIQRVLPG